jgi:hypothetical protein
MSPLFGSWSRLEERTETAPRIPSAATHTLDRLPRLRRTHS